MIWQRLKPHVHAHRKTVGRFILVGFLAAFTNLFSFVLLNGLLRVHYMVATSTAYVIATGLHFLLSRYFTFQSKKKFSRQIPKYITTAFCNFLINLTVVWVSVNFLQLPAVLGVILAIGSTVTLSYCLNRFWVFN